MQDYLIAINTFGVTLSGIMLLTCIILTVIGIKHKIEPAEFFIGMLVSLGLCALVALGITLDKLLKAIYVPELLMSQTLQDLLKEGALK